MPNIPGGISKRNLQLLKKYLDEKANQETTKETNPRSVEGRNDGVHNQKETQHPQE